VTGIKGRQTGDAWYAPDGTDIGAIPYVGAGGVVLWLTPGASGQVIKSTGVSPAIPSYQTDSTGGGGGGNADDPDIPPASPSADDHEFTFGDTIGGTTLGSPATAPVITVANRLQITGSTAGAAAVKGVSWTAPTKPYVATTKVTIKQDVGNYCISSIFFRNASSGRLRTVAIFQNSGSNNRDYYTGLAAYTSLTTRSANSKEWSYHKSTVYLRASYSGSTIKLWTSADGREDNWAEQLSETDSTHFTGGNLPDEIGLGVDSFSGNAGVALFDYLRFT
jgi:hypothetical protein